MPQIQLRYGMTSIPFEYDEGRFDILGEAGSRPALSDIEIGQGLDNPIGSKPLNEIVHPGDTVLIVVPDATRQTACGQIVNLLVRRLIADGTTPHDIRIIIATGIHRLATEDEKAAILTPFIAQRIKTLDHQPRDLMRTARFGETSTGIPVELNRALIEHDHVILVGGVTFHYFAGFTGGRKLICPGLASAKTIAATHKLAFDCERMGRRDGVGTGLLDGNAVNMAFMEAVKKINPSFCINSIVNGDGEAVDLFSGDWIESHRVACEKFADEHTVEIAEKRGLVIASCGGFPHDINMIQAHKALESASRACRLGGTIVFVAECRDGIGRSDFLDWFDAENSGALAEKLCAGYKVNGQTAWSLLSKSERFKVIGITELGEKEMRAMRLKKADSIQAALANIKPAEKGYIMPFAAAQLAQSTS